MAAPIFQRTVVDSDGNVEIGAIVEVRNEANNELAPIFVDRALTVGKENPFITDETGLIEFFVERGEYKVRATSGDNQITWRYVQMLDTEFVASTDTAQTLTNKTINLANNTLVATSAQLRAAITDETGTGSAVFSISPALTGTPTVPTAAAGTNTTQAASTAHVFAERSNTLTLTNKTLTTPVLSATASGTTSGRLGYNSGALSYGTGSVQRTVVNTDEAQTLTNKTLTSPSITTPTGIVKGDVGLGNVDNTSDSVKNVATAATLTTARTINGTSFDGSANITTTNWGTSRTLSFTGDVTGTSSVNGSANVATAMTLANSGVTAASYGGNNSIPSLTVDAKGRVTAASVVVPSGTWAISISGVAATATILATARTIGGVSFNGSANIDLPGVNISGNQNTTGNAATATALATARTIGGVSFDGTANINLPGVNTTGNQNTTGTASNVTGTVAVANGGTGATSLTANNLVVGNGTSAVGFIAPGTAGNVLTSNGTVWQSVPAAASGGGVTVAASAPAGPSDGDLWFDTTNNTLKIWITSSWRGTGSYV